MIAKRKGVGLAEAESERSVEQRREPMNKNRIGGIRRRTSGPTIAKSISIKSAGCKSGGCALKAVELTSGGLLHVPGSGLRGEAIHPDRAAEVSSGHTSCASDEGPNGRKRRIGGATRSAISGRKPSFGWPLARRRGVKLCSFLAKGPKRSRRSA